MMHQICLNGIIYRTWKGACPGVEDEWEKARRGIDGYTYTIVADGEYPEGEPQAHFDIATGTRVVRKAAPAGYRYESEAMDAALVPADGSEGLSAWIEAKCDEIEVVRDRRLESGYSWEGRPIKTDDGSQRIANAFLTAVVAGVCQFPIEWKCADNGYIYFHDAQSYGQFAAGMLSFGQAIFKASWDAKDALRSCTTYESALAAFESYMGA
jgi:hypothetical protein